MFKLIHTSDWHLGQNFYGYDRSEEQRDFLRQLAAIVAQEQPDALLVSGDIYHTAAPSSAAVSMYVEGMLDIHKACPGMAIVVIAGNHDSASRLESDSLLWRLAGVRVLGGIARDSQGLADLQRHIIPVTDKGIIAAVPYAHRNSFPKVSDEDIESGERQRAYFEALLEHVNAGNPDGLPVVLMAHLAVNNSDFTGHDRNMTMECVEIDALGQGYDYAALGHIHRPQQVSNHARYCGTPVPVSFDEQCEHSVSIVTIERHGALPQVTTTAIKNIRPLHTIPAKDPVDLEAALALVEEQRNDVKNAYIRLNVAVERYLPNGAQERAAKAVNAQQGRFCEIKKTALNTASGPSRQMTVEEFSRKQPIEVANQYYLEKIGRAMTDDEKAMFNYVQQLVEEENRQ
ncbi:MAG: exonuclease SbcCD subunit D [Muribaculaceae bacterium]|nr:exonuclease SbcCD subunit D [Muribaculaceae bacterium]